MTAPDVRTYALFFGRIEAARAELDRAASALDALAALPAHRIQWDAAGTAGSLMAQAGHLSGAARGLLRALDTMYAPGA